MDWANILPDIGLHCCSWKLAGPTSGSIPPPPRRPISLSCTGPQDQRILLGLAGVPGEEHRGPPRKAKGLPGLAGWTLTSPSPGVSFPALAAPPPI